MVVDGKILGEVMGGEHSFHDRTVNRHRGEDLLAFNRHRPVLIAEHVSKANGPSPAFLGAQGCAWSEHHDFLEGDANEHPAAVFFEGEYIAILEFRTTRQLKTDVATLTRGQAEATFPCLAFFNSDFVKTPFLLPAGSLL